MSVSTSKMDKTIVRKGKLKEQGNDFEFWQTQSYEARLATVEQIRQEYNSWKYGSEQGFQRVYRVIKRAEK
ncbi:MAG TPA: hypothetical protein VGB68_01770 [Pyrinomonadaceae bacterium]